jgi:hypothetical protein
MVVQGLITPSSTSSRFNSDFTLFSICYSRFLAFSYVVHFAFVVLILTCLHVVLAETQGLLPTCVFVSITGAVLCSSDGLTFRSTSVSLLVGSRHSLGLPSSLQWSWCGGRSVVRHKAFIHLCFVPLGPFVGVYAIHRGFRAIGSIDRVYGFLIAPIVVF